MRYFPYIFKNLMRKKLRSSFTITSMALSLFLVTFLYAYMNGLDELGEESDKFNRVIVTHAQGLGSMIPYSHIGDLRKMKGVAACTEFAYFGGKYKEEKLQFAQFGVDVNYIMDVMVEFKLPPKQLEEWKEDSTGCVVGDSLAKNKGWTIGSKIPLKGGTIFQCDLELTVRGIFSGPRSADTDSLWFHYRYLDQECKKNRDRLQGLLGAAFVKLQTSDDVPKVIDMVDEKFSSSWAPARAHTEKAFQKMFVEMLGNVQGFIRNTSLAVVFSLICVAGNAMAMSMRERTREVAVLKAIGFGRLLVLAMVLAEAVLISMIGGVIGVFLCKAVFDFDLIQAIFGVSGFGRFSVPTIMVLYGLLISGLIGFASGIIPAGRAATLSVIDGLRRVV